MFRSLLLFRRLLATTFLVVFGNVLVGQCWCATLNPAAVRPAKTPACHPTPAGHAGPPKAHQPPPGKHDCCKNKTASLLAALVKPSEKGLSLPTPALLPAAHDLHSWPAAGQWHLTSTVRLVPRHYLPPKIPDIRIFIRSLTV